MIGPVRYQSDEEDSGRWIDFPFRDGDIVISTRSKSGTTWMQMICALLVFQRSEFPAPLSTLSPWLDWLGAPRADVVADLEEQQHRRFIKSHTPLDGLPLDPRATFIVVARHPLDAAVSLYHQGNNKNREREQQLLGRPADGAEQGGPRSRPIPRSERRPPRDWLLRWIDNDPDPRTSLDSLPGVMWHLADAWNRRHDDNVVLVHYDDLRTDLDDEMRRLAAALGMDVPDHAWPALVEAATFDHMRSRADDLVPGNGVLDSGAAFFRRGSSGAAAELLSDAELARYRERAAAMAPPDLLAWLHREPG